MPSSEQSSFTIEESIVPRLLDRQKNKISRPEHAVNELVDNILDARIHTLARGDITLKKDYFAIEDAGASGMDLDDLRNRWAKWGNSGKDDAAKEVLGSKGFIGTDAIGGKAAIDYLTAQGGTFQITCSKSGDNKEYQIFPTKVGPRVELRKLDGTTKEFPFPLNGRVKIEINGVSVNFNPTSLAKHLGITYALAIENHKLILAINEQEIKPIKPVYDEAPEYFSYTLKNGTNLTFEVGIRPEDDKSNWEPGLMIYVLGRLIKTGWTANQTDIKSSSETRRIIGRVALDTGRVGLNITKQDILDTEEWHEIGGLADEVLRPLVHSLKQKDELKRLPKGEAKAFEIADRISRMVAPSPEDRTYGIKKPNRNDITSLYTHSGRKSEPGRENLPRTPAPLEGVGNRPRLGKSHFVETARAKLGKTKMFDIEPIEGEGGEVIWKLVVGDNYAGYNRARDTGTLTEHLLMVYAAGIAKVKVFQQEIAPDKEAATAFEYAALFVEEASKKGYFKKGFFG